MCLLIGSWLFQCLEALLLIGTCLLIDTREYVDRISYVFNPGTIFLFSSTNNLHILVSKTVLRQQRMFCVQKRYSAWEIMSIFRKHQKCLVRCCNNNNNDLCLSGGGNFNEGEKCIIWFVKRMQLQLYIWADADFRLSIYLPSKQQASKKHWAFATNVNILKLLKNWSFVNQFKKVEDKALSL